MADTISIYNKELDIYEVLKRTNFGNLEEALYSCDLSDIIHKYYRWKKYMPRVIPFYAVKCNDNINVLKILSKLGTGFDCASKGELSKVLSLNIDRNKIIFANPTKLTSHLLHAVNNEIYTMTFDNSLELYKIKKFCPKSRLILRIKCEAEKAQCPLGAKFGCDPELEAPNLILLAKNLNLEVVGISFHVGSGCMDFPVFQKAISTARKLFDFAELMGTKLHLLDIGGGFPGDIGSSVSEVAHIVNKALADYFPKKDVKIIAEPGRFFVSSAFTLLCKVHSIRELKTSDQPSKIMYYINDGVYGSFNCILYDHQIPTPQYIKNFRFQQKSSCLWGPTCDALDQISESNYFPELNMEEVLIFVNMGAYTIPVASEFNGFALPQTTFFIQAYERDFLEVLS